MEDTRIEKLNRAMQDCAKSPIANSMNGKYTNRLFINGFILEKPQFQIQDTGREKAYFRVYQLYINESGLIRWHGFTILSWSEKVIAKLKELKYATLVNCECELMNLTKKSSYFPRAIQLDVIANNDWSLVE